MVALHGNAVLCTFFDENEVCYAAGCSVIYHLLLMSSAAIFTSSEVHLARLALLGRLCREMSNLPAGYIPQHKATLASSNRSLGFIVYVKCCTMVNSVQRWWLSLSWPIQSDHLLITNQMIPALEQEHSLGKTEYIPVKQVLVRSWLWIFFFIYTG